MHARVLWQPDAIATEVACAGARPRGRLRARTALTLVLLVRATAGDTQDVTDGLRAVSGRDKSHGFNEIEANMKEHPSNFSLVV